MPKINISQDYHKNRLTRVLEDPLQQFALWYKDAEIALADHTINAMTLATVDTQGQPHCRVVLLKEWDAEGFVFYTNYDSAKALDIAEQPQVALLFWWPLLERQIRIEGRASQVSAAMSDAYFHSRPLASQIAAILSPQSQPITDITELRQRQQAWLNQYQHQSDALIERPHWGGYCVSPQRFEFWQGGADRLHDRWVYQPAITGDGWMTVRLAP